MTQSSPGQRGQRIPVLKEFYVRLRNPRLDLGSWNCTEVLIGPTGQNLPVERHKLCNETDYQSPMAKEDGSPK